MKVLSFIQTIGFTDGRTWASELSTPPALERALRVLPDHQGAERFVAKLGSNAPELRARFVAYLLGVTAASDAVEKFWEPFGALANDHMTLAAYLSAFLEGALDWVSRDVTPPTSEHSAGVDREDELLPWEIY